MGLRSFSRHLWWPRPGTLGQTRPDRSGQAFGDRARLLDCSIARCARCARHVSRYSIYSSEPIGPAESTPVTRSSVDVILSSTDVGRSEGHMRATHRIQSLAPGGCLLIALAAGGYEYDAQRGGTEPGETEGKGGGRVGQHASGHRRGPHSRCWLRRRWRRWRRWRGPWQCRVPSAPSARTHRLAHGPADWPAEQEGGCHCRQADSQIPGTRCHPAESSSVRPSLLPEGRRSPQRTSAVEKASSSPAVQRQASERASGPSRRETDGCLSICISPHPAGADCGAKQAGRRRRPPPPPAARAEFSRCLEANAYVAHTVWPARCSSWQPQAQDDDELRR